MLKEGVRLDRVRGGRQKYRRVLESPYGPLHTHRKTTLEGEILILRNLKGNSSIFVYHFCNHA